MNTKSKFDIFIYGLYFLSFAIYGFYLIDGFDFYSESIRLQPRHEDYRNLRPAGFRGHGFGIIGSAMMVFMLTYSLRKRTKFFRDLFALSYWLKIHIYCGIMGPLLIILHTSFKVKGLVAVSFWSMAVVALSGVLGRYLYLQIPRSIGGQELSAEEISKTDHNYREILAAKFNISDAGLEKYENILLGNLKNNGPFITVFKMFISNIFRFYRKQKLKYFIRKEHQLTPEKFKELYKLIFEKIVLHRRLVLLDSVQQIFHYWHVLHKPFAIIMYLIMFIHIIVAVLMGYTWIF